MADISSGVQYIPVAQPFYANIFFWIASVLFIALFLYIIFYYVNTALKNRLGVRIHMPDTSLKTYWYKKGVLPPTFKQLAIEKTQDGSPIYHTYFNRPECVEHGKWGDYIDYDYGQPEPINPRNRQRDDSFWANILRFVSGLLDTDLAIDLLLSEKFKDFVKTMLVIILIAVCVDVGFSLVIMIKAFATPTSTTCNLAMTNQTLNTIRMGVLMAQ